jgi:hypothetical protein
LVRTADKGMQIRINAFVDQITQYVLALQMQDGTCYQETSTSGWYVYGGAPGNWTSSPAPPGSGAGGGGGGGGGGPTPPVSGGLTVRNGRVVDDKGNDVHLRGPNLRFMNWPDNQNSVMMHPIADRQRCLPVLDTLPGMNVVRFDAFESMTQFDAASPQNIIPYIDAIVNNGVFCEVECHIYPTLLQGGDLERVCGWYSQLARHYKDNPKVIWGTQNEPGGGPDGEINRIYDAIRNEGNQNLILMCPEGGWSWSNMNPVNYQRLRNVAWDFHYYGWIPNYSMDPAVNDQVLLDNYNGSLRFQSADGNIPMFVGEFSPCGFQNSNAIFVENAFWMDPNGLLVIDSVYRAPFLSGWMQWFWNTPETSASNGIGFLLKPDGNYNGSAVTDHGGKQMVEALRRGSPAAASASAQTDASAAAVDQRQTQTRGR